MGAGRGATHVGAVRVQQLSGRSQGSVDGSVGFDG